MSERFPIVDPRRQLRLDLSPEEFLVAWAVKITDEYATWFRALMKEDL
jgi:hypothetical protein